jgi:hypothetical protein
VNAIWHLTRDTSNDPARWDAVTALIVVAPNSFTARRLAVSQHGDEGADAWVDDSHCEHIGNAFPDVKMGVLMRSWTER